MRATIDPRWYQIGFLTSLLAWVLWHGTFTLSPLAMAAAIGAALATQAVFVELLRRPHGGFLSPLISSLSLCLLLRTESAGVAALAAVIAIASKFVLRSGGKHFFNPTNLGLLSVVLLTGQAWISPGQWGSGTIAAFAVAALGLLVLRKIGRLDITVAFLGAHLALQLWRVAWLAERPEVVLHRFSSGALLVFAFFMISDPRSTPDTVRGRVLFATLVAVIAYVLRFTYFVPAAPIWALLIVSPTTPLIDALWHGRRFAWQTKGAPHETEPPVPIAATHVR